LSFFSFGHCAEKKDKMTNSDQQYSTMTKGKKGQNRQTVISNTAQ
jgi:hypothetical protein